MTQYISEAASKITGSLSPASEASSSIGTQRGETGSAVKLNTALPTVELVELPDREADKAVILALKPYAKFQPSYAPSLSNNIPVGYTATGDLEAARQALEATLAPASLETIERAVTELAVLTKYREGGGQPEQMLIALYMGKLSEYPADAVLAVCRSWANENVFWPAWSELRERLEARVSQRRKMLEAVK